MSEYSDDELGQPPSSAPAACFTNGATVPEVESSTPEADATVEWDCKFTDEVAWRKTDSGAQCINEYVLGAELGRGSFSRVFVCERRVEPEEPGRQFAMKIMSKARLRKLAEYVNTGRGMKKLTAEDKVRREIEVMRHIYHRNGTLAMQSCSRKRTL